MAAAPAKTVRPGSNAARGEFSTRTLVLSALALALVLVGGVVFVSATTDGGAPATGRTAVAPDGSVKPESIPLPDSGKAPTTPGERGGWEQLTLFGVMLGGMLAIGVVVFRGGKKAKAGKQLWLAAAASGHDGAVDRHGDLDPSIHVGPAPPGPTTA